MLICCIDQSISPKLWAYAAIRMNVTDSTDQSPGTYAVAEELMTGHAVVVILCWLMESALFQGLHYCFTTAP